MPEFVRGLFESNFMPHGHCYLWRPEIVWLHAVSDSIIAVAYYTIPFFLIAFVAKRRDVAFPGTFLLFGAFILLCGTTHVLEIWSIWNGTYYLTGVVKAATAAVSIGTAVTLVPLFPKAIALPSPTQLQEANAALRTEVAAREQAERDLRDLNEELERRVAERTAELERVNAELRRQMAEREQAEQALKEIEWLLMKEAPSEAAQQQHREPEPQPYGDLSQLNTDGAILSAVGTDVLTEISGDYLDLLETSTAVYEKDGRYALGLFSSGWCRFMDRASRDLCGTDDDREALASGKWHCHESCWSVSKEAMVTGKPVDAACSGGIRLYAVPILSDEEVVGAINFGYGDPPKSPEKLQELAERYGVRVEELQEHAEAYASRPPFIVEVAKERLTTTANLLGEIVRRTQVERALRDSDTELRRLNHTLERRVAERTEELVHANHTLESRNRELQDFAYVASHDLKEPLRKVTTFADLLQSEYGNRLDEAALSYLARMQNATRRMLELIDGLLAFSRVSTNVEPFERVDLSQVAQGVLQDLETRIQETTGYVDVGDLPAVEADPMQMQQLLQNLVGNALKFHKPGVPPRVTVHAALVEEDAAASGGWVRLTVADNGIGFEQKYADRIFAPFQRLHGRSAYEGTGMGLAICRRIVERHGGRISVESAPGEGSVFTVELPLRMRPGVQALNGTTAP